MNVLLIAVLVLLYTGQSLFCRLYTAKRGGDAGVCFAVCYGAIVGLGTLVLSGFRIVPSRTTLVLGLLNAMILLLYNVSLVRAGSLGSYAFMMVLNLSGGILIPMLYDVLWLRTPIGVTGILGVLVTIGSFLLMNPLGSAGRMSKRYLIWVGLLFLANGLYGTVMNLQQRLSEFSQRNEMITVTFLGMAVVTFLIRFGREGKGFLASFRMGGKAFGFLLLSSLCALTAVHLLLIVMKHVDLTVLTVADNGGVLVLSTLCAFLLFHEPANRRTVLGMLAACLGIVLMSL